jgi:hypothetical protein
MAVTLLASVDIVVIAVGKPPVSALGSEVIDVTFGYDFCWRLTVRAFVTRFLAQLRLAGFPIAPFLPIVTSAEKSIALVAQELPFPCRALRPS